MTSDCSPHQASPCSVSVCASASWSAPSTACASQIRTYCQNGVNYDADLECASWTHLWMTCAFTHLPWSDLRLLQRGVLEGRSGRGIALILSGWRGFYVWLGRQGLIASNPVQDVRAPKAPKPLPKAMGVDDAVQFANFQSEDGAWFEARDAAMVELLYGSGLRVGELVGLDVQPGPLAKGWIDLQEAQAHVLGKGAKRRSVPVGSAALRALVRWLALRATPPGQPPSADGSAPRGPLRPTYRKRRKLRCSPGARARA